MEGEGRAREGARGELIDRTSGKSFAKTDAELPTSPAVTTNSEMSGMISYFRCGPAEVLRPTAAAAAGLSEVNVGGPFAGCCVQSAPPPCNNGVVIVVEDSFEVKDPTLDNTSACAAVEEGKEAGGDDEQDIRGGTRRPPALEAAEEAVRCMRGQASTKVCRARRSGETTHSASPCTESWWASFDLSSLAYRVG